MSNTAAPRLPTPEPTVTRGPRLHAPLVHRDDRAAHAWQRWAALMVDMAERGERSASGELVSKQTLIDIAAHAEPELSARAARLVEVAA